MTLRVRLPEIWKPVLGYEGWYEVSSVGRVRRIKAGKGTRVGQILKPKRMDNGYLYVNFSHDGKRQSVTIHKMVCEAFNGPRPSPKHIVNHDNGHKDDNWFENLEWVTRKENNKHAYDVGLNKQTKGSLDKRSRKYIITSPCGKIYRVKGLIEFTKKHSLSQSSMTKVATGVMKSYKGWGCSYDV